MTTPQSRKEAASHFREITGTAGLEQTLAKATRVLAERGIASMVIGGLAVQEHGYLRVTFNVDLVVPNVQLAWECLLLGGFIERPESTTVVTDPDTGYEVLLYVEGSFI